MDTTKGHFTCWNEVRNSIRRMKYLELAFYSNSVYISGKPLYAERGIVQLREESFITRCVCGGGGGGGGYIFMW